MQAHATAYLHLMRAAVRATDAEVFAFATSLTRLTPILAHREVDVAMELASEAVDDRFGGTRIATNLRALLASRHGHDTRGAIVVIASDGWDADPPEAMAAAMARLRRRAHRVVWLNPRAGAPGYVPRVGAMAAALPFVDDLLPAATLEDLLAAIERIAVPRTRARQVGIASAPMRVLVLGAGFGGLELTTRLSEELGDDVDVVLIDKADGFVFGFSKLDVMFGRKLAAERPPPLRRPREAGRAASCRPRSRRSIPSPSGSRPTPGPSRPTCWWWRSAPTCTRRPPPAWSRAATSSTRWPAPSRCATCWPTSRAAG